MAIFSTGVWMMGIFFFRQTLKLLLSYHGWMFEMHGQTSHFTKVWAVSRSRWRGSGIWFETLGTSFGVVSWERQVGHWHLVRGFVLVLRVGGPAPQMWLFLLFPLVLTRNILCAQICVRLLSSRRPMLYSFQTSLPKLPVPSVPATVQRVRVRVRHPSGAG